MSTIPRPSGDVKSDEEMKLVVDAARAAVAQEFQIAERLDAKARNQMTVAGAWYAVVQTFAGITLRVLIDSPDHHRWLFALIVAFAAVAGACLIVAMLYSYGVWRLHQESEITHEGLGEMLDVARDPTDELGEKLVAHYQSILALRRLNNKKRAERFKHSVPWWIAALSLSLGELVLALFALAAS
jgi:hypothetical protein